MSNETIFPSTRREFLRNTALVGLGVALPSFLVESVRAATPGGEQPKFKDDRVLVVVQLGGGNDGLNALVPYADDAYYRARPRLGLKQGTLLRVDDYCAFSKPMEPFKGLYDAGSLAVLPGVGYPNPDRSHFRSMEIWQTAVDSNRTVSTGWVGRYFDNCCEGRPDPASAINVGNDVPQAFDGEKGVGVSFAEPGSFRWREGKVGDTRQAFNSINATGVHHDPDGHTIDFLRHVSANAVLASDRVQRAAAIKRRAPEYPRGRLAAQLRTIAGLVAANMPTRIYYTSMGGFDTHANQAGQHERLLGEFAGALAAFQRDIDGIGARDRVVTMVFSEFGRRVAENGSGGTDHGTAGPMFLLGGKGITAGVHGKHPSLDRLDDGDLVHTTDFRAVYSELLEKWFAADPAKVLGKKFDPTGAVAARA